MKSPTLIDIIQMYNYDHGYDLDDVTKLFELPEIQNFLNDKDELKRLIRITKDTVTGGTPLIEHKTSPKKIANS